MPKDEFDFEDPMELSRVMMESHEETATVMCECFIEEYMRLGFNHKQILTLFKNPHYIGMHMVFQQRGEAFIRDRILEVFSNWGRPFHWKVEATHEHAVQGQTIEYDPAALDPTGAPIPKLNH